MLHVAKVLAQQAVDVFDAVRRFEGASELFEQDQPVKSHSFLHPFHQRPRGTAVECLKLTVDLEKGRPSLFVGRPIVCSGKRSAITSH